MCVCVCVCVGVFPGEFLSADAHLNGKTHLFIHTTVQIILKCLCKKSLLLTRAAFI